MAMVVVVVVVVCKVGSMEYVHMTAIGREAKILGIIILSFVCV